MKKNKTFTEDFFSAYIDLSKSSSIEMPLHCYKPLTLAEEHFDNEKLVWNMQRALPASFRLMLKRKLNLDIPINHPNEVNISNLDGDRWLYLIDDVSKFDDLPEEKVYSLLKLLFSLGFYKLCINLFHRLENKIHKFDNQLYNSIKYVSVNAEWILWLEDKSVKYSVQKHEELYLSFKKGTINKFICALHIFVYYARNFPINMEKIKSWNATCWIELNHVANSGYYSEFYIQLMHSRYYRAEAFIPYFNDDKENALKSLDISNDFAIKLIPTSFYEEILYKDNIFPISESYGKTALWAGEESLAQKYYERLIENDPYDSKAHVQYAEFMIGINEVDKALNSYYLANIYSPPFDSLSLFLAGQIHTFKGKQQLSKFFQIKSLSEDHLASSVYEELLDLYINDSTKEGEIINKVLKKIEGNYV